MAKVPDPLCAYPGYDPNWWSVDHVGRCSIDCANRLAAHICGHCPLMSQCQDQISSEPHNWTGVVMGGLITTKVSTRKNPHYELSVVTPKAHCTACRPSLARAR